MPFMVPVRLPRLTNIGFATDRNPQRMYPGSNNCLATAATGVYLVLTE